MKILNRDADYAVRVLVHMAVSGGRPGAAALAAALRVPGPFLRKILQILNKNGILRSQKGRGGGFSMARGPEKISLKDILEAFGRGETPGGCAFTKSMCGNHKVCLLRGRLAVLEAKLLSEAKKVTIKSLMVGENI